MMNASDIPFVAAAMVVGIIVTGVAFFILRALHAGSALLKTLSALAFPALLIAIIIYVQVWNPDPHGFIMVGLGFLAVVCLPVTILTTALLARRFNRLPRSHR